MSHVTKVRYSSVGPFDGQAHIEAYLNPNYDPVSCLGGHGTMCLCDVDLSRTAHLSYDKPVRLKVDVEDVESLIRAGAMIWLEYDVGRLERRKSKGATKVMNPCLLDMTAEQRAEVLSLVRDNKLSLPMLRKRFNVNMTQEEYTFLLRALGSRGFVARKLPTHRLIALHEQGKNPSQIALILKAEGVITTSSSVSRALKRMGVLPIGCDPRGNLTQRGKPVGWTKESGMSYTEFREAQETDGTSAA